MLKQFTGTALLVSTIIVNITVAKLTTQQVERTYVLTVKGAAAILTKTKHNIVPTTSVTRSDNFSPLWRI